MGAADAEYGANVNDWVNVVRRAHLGRTTKLVALTLATYANTDGTKVFPSLARITVQCCIGYSTARRALAYLRNVGLVERVARGNRRRGQADEYRLILGAQLLEHVKVPSPDEERAEIAAVSERRRTGGGKRLYSSPVSGKRRFTAHYEHGLQLTPDPPPSIETLPEEDPPSNTAVDPKSMNGSVVARERGDDEELGLGSRPHLPKQQNDAARYAAAATFLATLPDLGITAQQAARDELGDDATPTAVVIRAAALASTGETPSVPVDRETRVTAPSSRQVQP